MTYYGSTTHARTYRLRSVTVQRLDALAADLELWQSTLVDALLTQSLDDLETGRLRIQPVADGPLVLWGAVALCSDSGRIITHCTGPTLCRCGHSANKPFCDGAHASAGFVARE